MKFVGHILMSVSYLVVVQGLKNNIGAYLDQSTFFTVGVYKKPQARWRSD